VACVIWRIYYSDGSTFDSEQGSPEDAPSFGVVCIVQPDPDRKRNIMHGWDWYYYNDVEGNAPMWWGCDVAGLHDRLLHNLGVRAVKLGRTVSNDVWQKLLKRADLDPDFVGYLK
jgi:hypothetical protein